MAMRAADYFLLQIQLYDEEIKENIFNVVILCCFMK